MIPAVLQNKYSLEIAHMLGWVHQDKRYQKGYRIDIPTLPFTRFPGTYTLGKATTTNLPFGHNWCWLMYAVDYIQKQGFRFNLYSNEDNTTVEFRDMAITEDGGNLEESYGTKGPSITAVFCAVYNMATKINNTF